MVRAELGREVSFVDELPCVGAIELADSHRRDQLGIEVAEVDPVLATWRGFHWLPMSDASTGSATNGSQSPVPLNVLCGGLGVT